MPDQWWIAAESLGALLARARTSQGKSQARIAEILCDASGIPTVTGKEVGRWEREGRIPGAYWRRWLAVVFDQPIDTLERALAVSRANRKSPDRRKAGAAGLRTPLHRAVSTPCDTAGQSGRETRFGAPSPRDETLPLDDTTRRRGCSPDPVPTPGEAENAGPSANITELRRLDDLVGGADLTALVMRTLREAIRVREAAPTPPVDRSGREWLASFAGLAQLAGWVSADSGDLVAALAAHRTGLRAARQAGDRAIAGHLLGSAAHLTKDPATSLVLARAGVKEVMAAGSGTARALLLQRLAHAAARTGDSRLCERALADAETMYGRRRPGDDESWVYWLTEAEFAALTGRCYATLGRPRLAIPLLTHALASIRQPRSAAIYRACLSGAYLKGGDIEPAADLAGAALLDAVRAGSVRAAAQVRGLHARLSVRPHHPALCQYTDLAMEALPYLPDDPSVSRRPLAA